MSPQKPTEVQEAQHCKNHTALSAMGHKGATQAAFNRAVLAAQRAEENARLIQYQERIAFISPDGDVLPPGDKPIVH